MKNKNKKVIYIGGSSSVLHLPDDLSRLYFEHHGNEDHDKPNALHHSHFDEIKFALGHRVKLRMKLNLFGRMTSVTEVGGSSTHLGRSAPSSEVPSRSESKESLEEKDTGKCILHVPAAVPVAQDVIHGAKGCLCITHVLFFT